MRFSYLHVLLFFGLVGLGGLLLFPTRLDVVTLYRNSYLYPIALDLLDELERQTPEDERVALEQTRVLYLLGRYERTVELLEELTARNPRNPDAWRQLGQNYRALQQNRSALGAYEHLLNIAPADSQALYLLEEYYRWFQFGEKRAANLESIVAHFPDDFFAHKKLIDLYVRMGDAALAIDALERTTRAFPDSAGIRADLGQLYLNQKDERALPLFAALHERYPDRTDYFDGLLSALIYAGRHEEIVQRFTQFYRPRLEEGTYASRLGQLYLYLNQPEQAIRILEEKLLTAPSPDTRLRLIDLYALVRRYDRAAEQARILVAQEPDRVDYWQTYIDYLGAAGNREELVTALEGYLARWPGEVRLWRELGDAYEWVEDYPSALRVARHLLAMQAAVDEERERLARILLVRERYDEAAEQYSYLLRRHPSSPVYRRDMRFAIDPLPPSPDALAYARQLYQVTGPDSIEIALLLTRRYLEQDDLPRAKQTGADLARSYPDSATVQLRIGRLLLDAGQVDASRNYLLRAHTLDPNSEETLSAMAALLYQRDPSASLSYIEELSERRPHDPDVAYRLGLTYEALGDTSKMVAAYRRMLESSADRNRQDLFALRSRAHALFRTGQSRGALELLEQARNYHPQALELANDQAEILLSQGEYERALEILDEVPELR